MSSCPFYVFVGPEFGCGDVLALAESLGWTDPDMQPWTPEAADSTEELADEYLLSKGLQIVFPQEVQA